MKGCSWQRAAVTHLTQHNWTMGQKQTKQQMVGTPSLETLKMQTVTQSHDPLWQIQMSDPLTGCWLTPSVKPLFTSQLQLQQNVHQCCTSLSSHQKNPETSEQRWSGVSEHLLPGSVLCCVSVFWAVWLIEYSYCWCSGWRGRYHANRPSRLTFADRNEWMMKTMVLGQQWRSSCWNRTEKTWN